MMGSQSDWDQGGTNRQLTRTYLGPSVGWVMSAGSILLPVTSGSAIVTLGTTLVLVNYAGAVAITLPKAAASAAGAQALPGTFLNRPITVVDISGAASGTNTITITPGDGTIDGLASVAITVPYGGYVFNPLTPNAGYTLGV